jgi:hypothetical protein
VRWLAVFLAGMIVGGALAFIPFFRPEPVRHWRFVVINPHPNALFGKSYAAGDVIDCDYDCTNEVIHDARQP